MAVWYPARAARAAAGHAVTDPAARASLVERPRLPPRRPHRVGHRRLGAAAPAAPYRAGTRPPALLTTAPGFRTGGAAGGRPGAVGAAACRRGRPGREPRGILSRDGRSADGDVPDEDRKS